MAACVLVAVGAIVAGCAGPGAVLTPPQDEATTASESTAPHVLATPTRVELADTPFFPQRDYQCGPAALATVLAASGIAVDADELVPEVFLPGRRGSLQPELVAAARKRGRLPYLVSPHLQALVAQLDAGTPVMVMQKLGAGPWPGWHYAVLVGYDAATDEYLLRSGTDERLKVSGGRFLTTWDRAGRWAMVTLPPGVMPAGAEPSRYMEAAAGLEAVGRLDDAQRAYEAATRQWPGEALPRLGLANLAYARGDLRAAERGYREAIELEPGNVAARNNRAEVLMKLGCPASARQEIEAAHALAAGGPLAAAVAATAIRIAATPDRDAPDCPAPGTAAHSVP